MLAARVAATAFGVVVAAVLLSGCSQESDADPGSRSSASSAAPLPDNLCADVLPAVSAQLGFAEDSHLTQPPSAVCELTGPAGSSMRVSLTDFPDRAGLASALDAVCRTSVGTGLGQGQRRCQTASVRVPGQPYVARYAASYADPPSVVVMELRTTDDTVALTAPAELAGVEAALQSR